MKGLKIFIEVIRDLLWPLSSGWLFQKRDNEAPTFAFLVHPRTLTDVYKKFPQFRVFSSRQLQWMLRHFWPVIVSEVEGLRSQKTGKPIRGWIVTIPLTAEQMIRDRKKAVTFLRRAVELAYCRGANVIGLGALNASITYRGRDLQDLIARLNVGVTTGVGYTAYNICDLALAIMARFKLNPTTETFGVVGAAGAIGSATANYLMVNGVKNFILIDLERKHDRIHELVRELKMTHPQVNFHVSSQLADLRKCRLVITATNTPEALVKNEHLSMGTVVIDDAQPADIDPEVIEKREDVMVIEGGIIEANGINPNVNFGLKHKTDVFACLAEVMVLSANGRQNEQKFDYSGAQEIAEIGRQGKALGFGRAEFQNFKHVYTEKDLDYFYKSYIISK